MSKVSVYGANSSPTTNDYLLGNQASGPNTKRFLLSDLIALFINNIPATEGGSAFVSSGLFWTADAPASTRAASMSSGRIRVNTNFLAISGVTARLFTASKDTYIDVLDNLDGTGTLVYTEVANNAASPALSSNSTRIGIIITGASNIASSASINQGEENKILPIASSTPYAVTDSLGNLISPRDPYRRLLGYRQLVADITTTSTSITQATGLSCPFMATQGRKLRTTFFATSFGTGGGGGTPVIEIWDGTVGSGTRIGQANALNANSMFHAGDCQTTPATTTSKIFNIGHRTSSGTNTITSAATFPAFIRVEQY